MKLDAKKLKQLISEAMKERQGETMLLEEPVSEMATGQSVADRVDPDTRPERTAKEFVVMSSDRGERSDAENKQMYGEFKQKVKAAGFPFTEFVGAEREHVTSPEIECPCGWQGSMLDLLSSLPPM